MAILHLKQRLLCDKTVSLFVHIFDIISLSAAEFEEPKIGKLDKGLSNRYFDSISVSDLGFKKYGGNFATNTQTQQIYQIFCFLFMQKIPPSF